MDFFHYKKSLKNNQTSGKATLIAERIAKR